jgi:hypothetical protein
MLYE